MNKQLLILSAAFGLLLSASPSSVSAQDVQITGPLAGAPAVRHMRLYRRGRLMITPQAGFTLQEPYRRSIALGGSLDYHFTDWLGVGAYGAYSGLGINSNLTDDVIDGAVVSDQNRFSLPTKENFEDQLGTIDYMTALQLTFIPLRGKVAFFQRGFVDTDLFVFGGLGFMGVSERATSLEVDGERGANSAARCAGATMETEAECLGRSQTARSSRTIIAPSFGAGLNFYFTEYLGLSLQWRGTIFSWHRDGFDSRGEGDGNNFPDGAISSTDRRQSLNHMITIGINIFVPPHAEISE